VTVQARLQKTIQVLSPLQRVALLLQAQREGRELDPELSRISDLQQNKAFNRYIGLIYVINETLGALCYTGSAFSRFLDDSANQIRLLEQAAGMLETDLGVEQVKRPRAWRTAGEMPVSEFLRSLALELRHDLTTTLAQRWRELGALEQVWGELAEEFGGEDPVSPELRTMAEETRQRLMALAREFDGKRRLADPDEDTLAEMRHQVDAAFEQLGPLL
jgi:hypothetical protein